MLDALGQITTFFFSWFTNIFDLYTTCQVLSLTFTIWVLDRIFGIFDILKR